MRRQNVKDETDWNFMMLGIFKLGRKGVKLFYQIKTKEVKNGSTGRY